MRSIARIVLKKAMMDNIINGFRGVARPRSTAKYARRAACQQATCKEVTYSAANLQRA